MVIKTFSSQCGDEPKGWSDKQINLNFEKLCYNHNIFCNLVIFYEHWTQVNFALLMQELSAALHAENLILTAAVSAVASTDDAAYDVASISESADYIHLMTYDMHGSWETYTHHHSILYSYPGVSSLLRV